MEWTNSKIKEMDIMAKDNFIDDVLVYPKVEKDETKLAIERDSIWLQNVDLCVEAAETLSYRGDKEE